MLYDNIMESAAFIKAAVSQTPEIGIILGSGLGGLVDIMENKEVIPYSQIPHFPVSHVEGHAGNLVFGSIGGKSVVCMQGRFHYYEGFHMQEVTYPVYVMKQLGVRYLIVTNACGGINKSFKPGDLMIITDHINFSANNSLIGINDDRLGPRFPDMSNAYDRKLRGKAKEIAAHENIPLAEGVYLMVSGPTFDTPAEVRAYRILGADAVGMSTVPEVICAVHSGIKVLGFSVIVNLGCGLGKTALSHAETLREAEKASANLIKLVKNCVREI